MGIAHLLALHSLPEIGNVRLTALLDYFGGAEAAWQNPQEWAQALPRQFSKAALAQLRQDMQKLEPWELYERFLLTGAKLVTLPEPHYPQQLAQIDDPPYLLFYKGQLPQPLDLAIAIIGSRRATSYGREAAGFLAGGLAQAGVWVIAGLARGIDTAAHQAALQAGGKTLGVLGCGIDVIYPRENRLLFQQMAEKGCILTEYPLGMQPLAKNFPIRNRIISGLSQGVIVVEAGLKSGTQITVDYALNQGRSIYAVPGSIFSPFSQGTFSLLKNVGVKPVATPEDVLDDLRPVHRQPPPSVQPQLFGGQPEAPPPGLDELEQRIWQALAGEKRHFNDLAAELAVSASELSAKLTMCELKGLVKRADGQYFSRRTTGL